MLEPICEAKFHERSQRFRPNRSTEHAIAGVMRMMQRQKLCYEINFYIKGFFDKVDQIKLIKQLWSVGIRDKKLICIKNDEITGGTIGRRNKLPDKRHTARRHIIATFSKHSSNERDWWLSSQLK